MTLPWNSAIVYDAAKERAHAFDLDRAKALYVRMNDFLLDVGRPTNRDRDAQESARASS